MLARKAAAAMTTTHTSTTIMPTLFFMISSIPPLNRDEVALAELHAHLAQNRISTSHVKKDIGQRKSHQICLARKIHLHRGKLQRHGLCFHAVDLIWANTADGGDGFLDALLQIGKRGFCH